jgi:hypothetical protein
MYNVPFLKVELSSLQHTISVAMLEKTDEINRVVN